jgi:acetyl esterase
MNARISLAAIVIAVVAAACGFADEKRPSSRRPRPSLVEEKIRAEERLYRTAPEGELNLHLYFPADWKRDDARPAIVFFFGGRWKTGSYQQFVPQAEYFASRGLVAASADYRIESQHGTTPAQSVEDAKSAVRWLRSHAKELGIDPNKIIAAGGSAGGHLAAATALLPDFDAADDDTDVSCVPNALVLFNPVLNLTLLQDRKIGDGKRDMMKQLSPTLYLQKSAPPAVLFYGTEDKFLAHGEEYAAKARELGVRTDVYVAPDEGHGFFNRPPWTAETTKKAGEFLASLGYLKGESAIELPRDATELEKR